MKIGVIGCGKQSYKHISGIRERSENVEILVWDLNRSAAIALSEAKAVKTAGSISEIMDDQEVGAILICTPPASHYELIIKALDSGKNVFCEKPLCDTKSQAEAISAKCLETGCFVQVGYVYRFVPVFNRLEALLTDLNRPLGESTSAIFRIGGRGSHKVWKHIKEEGGGATNEMLVHMLDLAYWLFGDLIDYTFLERKLLLPRRKINGVLEDVNAEDYVVASCQSGTGINILFQADMITPAFRQSLEVQGTNGSFIGSIQPDVDSYFYLTSNKGRYMNGRNELSSGDINLFHRQMEVFLDNIKRGEIATGASAQDSLKIFDLIETS